MQERENRFIIDNIYEENIPDVEGNINLVKEEPVTLESFQEFTTDNTTSDNFIDSFKMEVPHQELSTVNNDTAINSDNNVDSDINDLVNNGSEEFVVQVPELQINANSNDLATGVENVSSDTNLVVEEPVNPELSILDNDDTTNNVNNSEEKVIEEEPSVYDAVEVKDDESLNSKEAFQSGRNLQDMINKILKIDDLTPVKVDIVGVNDKNYEENLRIQEEIEQKKKEQDTFQDEISKVLEKDTAEVVFKSDLLDKLKEEVSQTNQVSMLARYGEDYCSKDFVTNPAIGRDNEIKQLILTLLTPEKSAILIGKPGIGKTSIVEGLAYRLERNLVPDALQGYTIINIKTPSLLGTLPTGETRLQTLVDELKTLDKVILFIDEIHMLIGATNESSLDFANMFKEGLGRGQIKVIGATTTEEYERYILRDKAFVRRFQSIEVLEPNREHTIKILMGTLPKIEKETGAKMKYTRFIQSEIMAFIVDITSEYKRVYGIGSRYPDICLNLLKEAFSQCIFNNRSQVTIFDIKNAILNSKNIYPDVIRKEIVNFDEKFKKIIDEESIEIESL